MKHYQKYQKYSLLPIKKIFLSVGFAFSYKLQKLRNRTARVIIELPFDTSSNLLLDTRKWEKLSLRRKKALVMYKTIHDLAPEYLQRLFSQRNAEYNLRHLEGKLFTLPQPNTFETKFLLKRGLFVEQFAPILKKC